MLGDLPLRMIDFAGEQVAYVAFVPTSYRAGHAVPAILLVHGAGGNGPDFLSVWREFAEKQGVILIAPTLSLTAEMETKVSQLFPAIVGSAAKEWTIDSTRRYVFGYSAGGYSAFAATMMRPRYFAATGIFASMIAPDYESTIRRPERPMGIAYYIGDHDQFFSLAQTRHTRDLLTANGFEVHYVELRGRDHSFRAAAPDVLEDAWNIMRRYTLP